MQSTLKQNRYNNDNPNNPQNNVSPFDPSNDPSRRFNQVQKKYINQLCFHKYI